MSSISIGSEASSIKFKLNGLIFGHSPNQIFDVEIPASADVIDLRRLVLQEFPNLLSNVDPRSLRVWKTSITYAELEARNRDFQKPEDFPNSRELEPLDDITACWDEQPPREDLHLVVQVLQERGTAGDTMSDNTNWIRVNNGESFSFYAARKGLFNPTINGIHERTETISHISKFREILTRKRKAYSSPFTEGLNIFVSRNGGNYDEYFEEEKKEQPGIRFDDTDFAFLSFALAEQAWRDETIKERNVYLPLSQLGYYVLRFNPNHFEYGGNADWPCSLIARVQDELYSYTPRSDFFYSFHNIPFVIVEVQSNNDQSDRKRMLVQGACAARLAHQHRKHTTRQAVITALYIANNGRTSRYLISVRDNNPKEVDTVLETFDLRNPLARFKLWFELYNLLDHLLSDPNLSNDTSSEIEELSNDIQTTFPGFTSKAGGHGKDKGTKKGPTQGGAQNQAGLSTQQMSIYSDRNFLAAFEKLGYELDDEDAFPEWKSLATVPPTVKFARDSTDKPVVVKLARPGSEELSILKSLCSIDSPQNHTLKLLDVFSVDTMSFIVLPQAGRLDVAFIRASVCELAAELSTQFLEGVAFLHHNNIAHLDLKPQNVVLIERNRRLYIIDFDISVRVNGPDDMIDRCLGTPSWMAPEIDDEQSTPPCYSPIRADLWSCGKMLQFFSQQSQGLANDSKYMAYSRRLLSTDPKRRPLLPHPYTCIIGHNNAMKRPGSPCKTDVEPLESM